MRKITQQAIENFINGTNFKQGNTEVKVIAYEKGKPCFIEMYLHGNKIAERHTNKRIEKIKITNSGWFSNTTKERLNAIPGVSIQQKKGVWYLNGSEWNGKLIDIKK